MAAKGPSPAISAGPLPAGPRLRLDRLRHLAHRCGYHPGPRHRRSGLHLHHRGRGRPSVGGRRPGIRRGGRCDAGRSAVLDRRRAGDPAAGGLRRPQLPHLADQPDDRPLTGTGDDAAIVEHGQRRPHCAQPTTHPGRRQGLPPEPLPVPRRRTSLRGIGAGPLRIPSWARLLRWAVTRGSPGPATADHQRLRPGTSPHGQAARRVRSRSLVTAAGCRPRCRCRVRTRPRRFAARRPGSSPPRPGVAA